MMNRSHPPLYGLILAGGESRRMGRDKALLNYHGEPQGQTAFRLLARFCERVFLSCRQAQWETAAFREAFEEIPVIPDAYPDIGPLSGLLSAMEAQPDHAWLILACDMPLVDVPLLARLCAARSPEKRATVFIRPVPTPNAPTDGQSEPSSGPLPCFPEPLCGIYEPACLPGFQAGVQSGQTGLFSFLAQWREADQVMAVPLEVPPSTLPDRMPDEMSHPLLNLNTPEEHRLFLKQC